MGGEAGEVGDHCLGGGVVEDVADSLGGVVGVDGDVGAAGADDGVEGDGEVDRARQDDGNPVAASNSGVEEDGGHGVDAGVELSVGDCYAAVVDQSDGVGCGLDLVAHQRIQRCTGCVETGGVRPGRPRGDGCDVVLGQEVQIRDGGIGRGSEGVEYPLEDSRNACRGGAVQLLWAIGELESRSLGRRDHGKRQWVVRRVESADTGERDARVVVGVQSFLVDGVVLVHDEGVE